MNANRWRPWSEVQQTIGRRVKTFIAQQILTQLSLMLSSVKKTLRRVNGATFLLTSESVSFGICKHHELGAHSAPRGQNLQLHNAIVALTKPDKFMSW